MRNRRKEELNKSLGCMAGQCNGKDCACECHRVERN